MESTKQPPLKGLSQFLVEHEKCGEGFDIFHPDGVGSGRVSMKCRGCGVTYDYATATIEFEREVEFEPVMVGGSAAAAAQGAPSLSPPTPAEVEATVRQASAEGAKDAAPPQDSRITQEIAAVPLMPKAPPPPPPPVAIGPPKPKGKGPRKPPPTKQGSYWTRDRKIIAGLLGFAVLALAFAAIRLSGGGEEAPSPTSLSPAPVTPGANKSRPNANGPASDKSSSPKSKSQAASQEQPTGKQGAGEAGKQPAQASEPAPRGEVEKVVETERFSLIVPNVWEERQAAGGFVLAPPGDAPVSVQVYYENDPGMSLETMVAQTRDFLRSRDIETRLQPVERLQVDGVPAFRIRAVGPAGTQIALGVLDNPYRYLAIESLDPGAPAPAEEEANRALDTFLPR